MNKLWKILAACVVLCGCEDPAEGPSNLRGVPPKTTVTAPAAPAAAPTAAAQAAAAQPAATPDAGQVGAPTPGVEREKAQVGVGRKGSGYGGGVITEPVHQYFAGKDRITFEIEIPQAMKLFQAEHNRFPKDFAEFKRAILDPSQIVLPDLYPGDRYVYDAKEHELMVEHHAPGGPAE